LSQGKIALAFFVQGLNTPAHLVQFKRSYKTHCHLRTGHYIPIFVFSVFDKKDTGGLASQAGTQGYVQTFVFPAPVGFLPFVQGGRFVGIMQFAPYFIFHFVHFAKDDVVSI